MNIRLRDLERELSDWLTASEVARRRGISRQAVHQQLREGKGGYRSLKTPLGYIVDPASVPEDADEQAQPDRTPAGAAS